MHMGIYSSPDSKRLYYLSGKDGSVHELDLASGTDRVVVSGGPEITVGRTQAISLSPDGRTLAVSRVDAATKSQAVVLVPLAGGEPRELLRGTESQQLTPATWMLDGRAVLVTKLLRPNAPPKELWLVPTDGTAPRKLDFDANRLSVDIHGRVSIHPDGKRIAFVVGALKKEVWVFENLLSALK